METAMSISSSHDFTNVNRCLCCGSASLRIVLDYGLLPLTDNYKTSLEASVEAPLYPLRVLLCGSCSHLQLAYQVSPRLSYSEYRYKTSVTKDLPQQFLDYAFELSKLLTATETPTHLDVGSNDGTFIQACIRNNIRSYGVEPAQHLAETCTYNGLPTAHGYFDTGAREHLASVSFPVEYDCITFNNVLANVPDPLESLATAKKLLKDENSFICIQSGYHPGQFRKGLFDWVYHEHFSYFTLRSIATLARRSGLYIRSYSVNSIRGGSMRVLLTQKEVTTDLPFEYYSHEEHFSGLRCFISESARLLDERLISLQNKGYQIYGFGASHSTGILVKTFGIEHYITSLYDDNQSKHEYYMPGTSLRVNSPTHVSRLQPESAMIVLAWQYFDAISNRLTMLGYPGVIINPVLL